MTRHLPIIILMLFLIVSPIAIADTIKVQGQKIEYDEKIDYDSMSSYYKGDILVLSTFDDNGDGKADQWFIYDEGFVVKEAMQDSDKNGKPDYFVGYDADGNAVSQKVSGQFFKDLAARISQYNLYILTAIGLILIIVFIIFLIKKRKHAKKHKEGKPDNHPGQENIHKHDESRKHEGSHKHEEHHETHLAHQEKPKKKRNFLLLILLLLVLIGMFFFQNYITHVDEQKIDTFTPSTALPLAKAPEGGYDPVNQGMAGP